MENQVVIDKLTQEIYEMAGEEFDQFPMATPQKKMIKTYEDSKKG